jgi:DNA-binding response OmpR family regulator
VRVLLVDDEIELRSVVTRALTQEGHAVSTAGTLASAREALEPPPDVLVLDLALPDGVGLALCRELRMARSQVPILVLTAHSEVARRVEALDAGADDFLAKPFAVAELRARVRALARRGPLPRGLIHRQGELVVDFAGRHASRAGSEVPVTAREWAILELLARHGGRLVVRADLLEGVWGEATDSAAGSLEVLVARLRRKLGSGVIRTVRGEGYALGEER